MSTDSLYESDFYVWTERQAQELKRAAGEGSNSPIDWTNLAGEIESLGRSDCREVASYVRLIIEHLVKLAYSPVENPRAGWQSEVREYRTEVMERMRSFLPEQILTDDWFSEPAAPAPRKNAP